MGDDILRQLVNTIKENRRVNDMLFRYGGEEFVLLLPESNLKSAVFIAEQIRHLLSKLPLPDNHQQLTVSIGVCELNPSMSADDWLKQADLALYKAKKEGRNKVCSMTDLTFTPA